MYDTYMPNKTISVPEDVVPIIDGLGVPFSTWVADQLRHPDRSIRRETLLIRHRSARIRENWMIGSREALHVAAGRVEPPDLDRFPGEVPVEPGALPIGRDGDGTHYILMSLKRVNNIGVSETPDFYVAVS